MLDDEFVVLVVDGDGACLNHYFENSFMEQR